MKKTALLIIDMQNDFVLEDAPFRIKGALGIVGNLKKVLNTFRKKNLPVFHLVRVHRKDGSDVEITRKERFLKTPYVVAGTKGAEIIDELKPGKNEYIVKKIRMSAFLNTELDSILGACGIKDVVIVGIQTPNCIRATAFDAVALNYNTCLVSDAISAQDEATHKANLKDMQNIGIKIINADEIETVL